MSDQPLLLAIETATKVCSVALFRGDSLVAVKEIGGNYSHSENLASFAQELLQCESLHFSSLDGIIVSKGPGSYTGLRIGVSFAKGLCFALDIPLVSVGTLDGMTWRATKESEVSDAYYCPMIDARRLEVYTTVFNNKLEQIEPNTASVLDEHLFEKYYKEKPFFIFGDGSEKALAIMNNKHIVRLETCLPSAKNLGELGYKKYEIGGFEDLAYFAPFYLKEFVAMKPKALL